MPKYMTLFSYSTPSVKGMVDKPQDRRAAADKLFGAAGGKIECMYFCFGDSDGVVITEFPDEKSAAAALLAAGSSGAFTKLQTSQVISTGDAVDAMKLAHDIVGSYTPPAG